MKSAESRQRSWAIGCLVACLVSLAGVGCDKGGKGAAAPDEQHELVGASAPDFSIPDTSGQGTLSPSQHAGKVVIVDFWATWCDPCKESFPFYQALTEKYGERLVVLAVSVDEEPAGIADFVGETAVKFAVGWDEGQSITRLYNPSKMPTSYIIDQNGVITHVHAGFNSEDEQSIREQLEQLLK